MRNWTKDQLAAIEARNCNLLVSAAAGSGKTALLIERIKRLILDEGVDVRELLVMTFTRAAASEMKERLRQALTDALTAQRSDFERITDQLYRLNRASISTLDAFCAAFLRENFQTAGIAPDFKPGNEAELKMLRREAIEEVLEEHYAQIPEDQLNGFGEMAEMFGNNRSDEPLITLILKFYTFLQTLPDPEDWCTAALSHFDGCEEDFFESFWGGQIRLYALEQVEQAEECLVHGINAAGDHPLFKRTRVILETEQKQAETLKSVLDAGDYQSFSDALSGLVFQTYYGGRPKEEDDKILGAIIKNHRQTAKDILVDLQKKYGQDCEQIQVSIAEMKAPVEALIEVTKAFKTAYFSKKQTRGLLDFSDMEQLTLQVLKENAVLRQNMQQKYRYVFIDEYQDTNGIQEAILQCIVRQDNYFMVGDVKQSIYRFRLADPGIFIAKLHDFGKVSDDDNATENRLIALGQNFRSSASVIDSVNTVFEKVMTEKVGEVAYDAQARLYQGLAGEGPVMPAEIHLLSKDQNDTEDEEGTGLTAVEQEAFYIASKIQEMIGQPLYRTRAGQSLPLRYRDIGILMRGVAGKGPIFRRVFKDAGIPLYFDGGEIYYNTTEVTLIINLLKLIDNPLQDLPLLAYILSPIGGFTVEDCAQIRQHSDAHYFHQVFWHYDELHEEPDSQLKARISAFDHQLKQWRHDLHFMDVQSFLWKIYRETGYYTFVGGLPGGEQRQSNLRQLLTKAAAYQNSTMKGIFHFIRFVEDLRQRKIDDVPPGVLDGQEDAVQLMTIHKSKGLEFPVVFIAGAAGQFNTVVSHQPVLFHKDLGLCPECIRMDKNQRFPTAAYTLCHERQRIENLSEEMRLLYVAMTRAEERLFFVGSLSEKQLASRQKKWQTEVNDYFCSHVRGALDWVMMTIQNEPACFKVINVENSSAATILRKPAAMKELTGIGASTDEIDAIRAKLSWCYPYAEGFHLPEKLSVTGISKMRRLGLNTQELPDCAPRPLFMQQLRESEQSKIAPHHWSGAELGTAMHAVLSDLNLIQLRQSEHLRRSISDHADEMVRIEKLDPDLRQAVNLDLIADFFEGSLGQRLLSAETIWREKPFNYGIPAGSVLKEWQGSDEKIVIQGMIDCCFIEEDQWVLLDYKTDWYENRADIEALQEKYREQIELYAEALEVLTGRKVKEKLLVLLKGNDVVKIDG